MKIQVDVHTHSIASGHAYSTLEEMVAGACRRGLKGFVLSDHGPGLHCGPHIWHFYNMRVLPRVIRGVRVYRGAEVNIMDGSGALDMDVEIMRCLDFVLAGFHEEAFKPASLEENTRAMIGALNNPYVDAISHPDNPAYPVDFRAVAQAAKAAGKALEINDSSFRIRRGSDLTCPILVRACAEAGAIVVCGSDAHWSGDVGRLDRALSVLEEEGFPRNLVLNLRAADFDEYISAKRARFAQHS